MGNRKNYNRHHGGGIGRFAAKLSEPKQSPSKAPGSSHHSDDREARSEAESNTSTSAGVKRRSPHDDNMDDDGWQTIQNGRPQKKAKKLPKKDSNNYPKIHFSQTHRLQNKILVSDLRNLITYILADGSSPQWVAVTHRPAFRKVVTIMVPGLEEAMFKHGVDYSQYMEGATNKKLKLGQAINEVLTSSDDYYPRGLKKEDLPAQLQPFADIFPLIWPVRATGNDKLGTMYSPMTTMLTAPLAKVKEETTKKGPRYSADSNFQNVRTPITEFVATPEEYLQNEFSLHPAMLPDDESRKTFKDQDGWVHTDVENLADGTIPDSEIQQGSITTGHDVYAIDCEMCMTGEKEFSLTRISIVSWDGEIVMDELVKPDKPITDYVTQYSGISEAMLAPVTTTLRDIQQKLLKLLTPRSILLGHSLDSDLKAIQLTHPFIVDTTIAFPHPAGPAKKHALRWLSQKYLNREIQKGHGTSQGHDSVEDARTCLDLMKKKCEKGKRWASGDSDGENLFKRLARAGTAYRAQGGPEAKGGIHTGKSTAAIDWGDPRRTMCSEADFVIGCHSDADLETGILRAVAGDPDGKVIPGGGVDFVWGRMRELEALMGWWNHNKTYGSDPNGPPSEAELLDLIYGKQKKNEEVEVAKGDTMTEDSDVADNEGDKEKKQSARPVLEVCLENLSSRLKRIYDALPPCTALIVLSGSGDPREMSRLQAQRAQHKKEYHTPGVKWDQISVPWTDTEEQLLRAAAKKAKEGVGFITVK